MKKIIFAALIGFAAAACNTISDNPNVEAEAADDDISQLKSEVMAVHDSAMAKMSTTNRQMSELKNLWQTAEDSLPYRQAFRELKQANDDMMDWMRSFELPEEAPEDELREYLLEEKRSIQAVHAEMEKAIEEAAFLLKNTTADAAGEDSMNMNSEHMDHEGHQH